MTANLQAYAYQQQRLQLEQLAKRNDCEQLHQMLLGKGIPALGGGETSAERILLALEVEESQPRWLMRRLAELLAKLLQSRADQLDQMLARQYAHVPTGTDGVRDARSAVDAKSSGKYIDDSLYLFNLFQLAAFLPRHKDVHAGLIRFHEVEVHRHVAVQAADLLPAWHQLRRSLVRQQIDDSLGDYWLNLLAERATERNGAERRNELLEAWEGLLALLAHQAGGMNFRLLEQGLSNLATASSGFPGQGHLLLNLALARLHKALGLSLGQSRFVDELRPYWQKWSEPLRTLALRYWPALWGAGEEAISGVVLPANCQRLWQALPPEIKLRLREYQRQGDLESGRQLIENLLFETPNIDGLAPQQIRAALGELQNTWFPLRQMPVSASERIPDISQQDERLQRKPERIDRQQALASVNKTMAEIGRRLERGDLTHAQDFLGELIRQQSAQNNSASLLAKTLANAATLARNAGFLDWAETLLREAVNQNNDDAVCANGLSALLKRRGLFVEAEALYRQNIARWPNNEVVANGLAEVLKAQGQLTEAEALYRQNVARWPNNEVVIHGLANVLRKQKRLVEALSLLSDGMPADHTDVGQRARYDMHLRAMLMVDLGRTTEARELFQAGLRFASSDADRSPFIGGLAYLELRSRHYEAALASLPSDSPVVALRVVRAHACVMAGQVDEARQVIAGLRQARTALPDAALMLLERMASFHGVNTPATKHQLDADEMEQLFDTEFELLMAA